MLTHLPNDFTFNFNALWNLHPEERHLIRVRGNEYHVPRFQQAYGKDYAYSGNVNIALPITEELQPFLDFAKTIDSRLNGILVNWYDAAEGHYIGPHSDDIRQLIPGSNIITISLGATRVFRVKNKALKTYNDYELLDRNVYILGWDENIIHTHEILKPQMGDNGKRISITCRAFVDS